MLLLLMKHGGMFGNKNVPQFLYFMTAEEGIMFHTESSSLICSDVKCHKEVYSSSELGKHQL